MVQKKNLIPESNSRSDDIHVPSWQAGKPAAFYLNMVSSLQNSSHANVALKAGHALETAEERKMARMKTIVQKEEFLMFHLQLKNWGFLSDLQEDAEKIGCYCRQ